MQPMYRGNEFVTAYGRTRGNSDAYIPHKEGGTVTEDIFERGLCLPSDNKMAEDCDGNCKEMLCIEGSVMSMAEFVEYWNGMSGFTSLLLSLVSVILLVVSIAISIHTARMPYIQQIMLVNDSFGVSDDGKYQYQLWLLNSGNATTFIKGMVVYGGTCSFRKYRNSIGEKYYPVDKYRKVKPGKVVTECIECENTNGVNEIILELQFGLKGRRRYKRRITFG